MKISLFSDIFTLSTEIPSYEEPSVWCGICYSFSFVLFFFKCQLKTNLKSKPQLFGS